MKTSILASAIALGLGLAGQANAFSTISFDMNGAAAGGALPVSTFDWLPGNALSLGSLGIQGQTTLPSIITTVYQAKLGLFINDVNGNQITTSPFAGTEFTVQATLVEQQFGIGTATAAFAVLGGTINMYYDTTPDANDITGAGYGDGLLILSGSVLGGTGTFTDFTRATAGLIAPVLLDQNGVDNQGGVLSHSGNGSSTIDVHVDYQDSNFFKSVLTSLVIGLNDTTNLADPFRQANPSDQVVGQTPSYSLVGGQQINGGDCPKNAQGQYTQRCDFHFQSDASTSFNTSAVPEPATLALLGLGLLGLGLMRKRA